MPDYKELYLKMARASEQAVCTLIQAQLECEECYLSSCEANLTMVPFSVEKEEEDKLER
ncbi:hypothetical protein [Faecalispora anaeroviscerum]|uniref:hypothetical protein n=1 Tax=Faecalispora anaeroviscerum TaxID=2991836 RepID=UPI0024BBC522|nr:hypothetical protein [Faecalispora anaeroviscerum]